ncbi:MAG: hypothetical protein HZB87_07405, partial [Desulfatitalea sp.]|nr:hypothetical protein [Desulfatitalea sp.]
MKGLYVLFLVMAVVLAGFPAQVSAESLAAPELDRPKDKAKNQVATTVLSWKEVPGAKGYRVMVSLSAESLTAVAPKAACADCLVDQKVAAPTYQIPMKILTKNAPYFWTVRTLSETEEGPGAAARSYTLAST